MLIKDMEKQLNLSYEINNETLQDLINLSVGLFNPLEGFVNRDDYYSIIDNYSLADGSLWTIPITFDVDKRTFTNSKIDKILNLMYKSKLVAKLKISDWFEVDAKKDAIKIFKTDELAHPGVLKEVSRNRFRLAGKPEIIDESILLGSLKPSETRKVFKNNGWKTIVGFQTRNPIHKAHEHLQRIGLEVCDGLFINPLVGWKKIGDFSEEAVTKSYEAMIDNYYPQNRVYFNVLKTPMRYAGPREAIFHALVRKNLGCTHFIIGRDHAGVGNYYGKYEAHELARKLSEKQNFGIELLLLGGPYYCKKCAQIVTEKSCGHNKRYKKEISGTEIRAAIGSGENPETELMRLEILEVLNNLSSEIFIR